MSQKYCDIEYTEELGSLLEEDGRGRREGGTVTLRDSRAKRAARASLSLSLTHLPSLLTSLLICQMTFLFVSKHARDSSLFIHNLVVVMP